MINLKDENISSASLNIEVSFIPFTFVRTFQFMPKKCSLCFQVSIFHSTVSKEELSA